MSDGRLSAEGRMMLARTSIDEDRLRRLVWAFPEAERRAFWIGVLVRDGAVTVDQALRGVLPTPPPAPLEVVPPVHRDLKPAVPGRCAECGGPLPPRRGTRKGRGPVICRRPECQLARWGVIKYRDADPEVGR